MNVSGKIVWTMVLSLFVYTFYSCYHQYRSGKQRQAITMVLGMTVFILFTLENMLVRSGLIDFIYLAAYGLPALLVIMGISLHRDSIDVIERVYAVTDHVPASVYIKDVEGRYLMVNRKFQQMRKLNSDQVQGKTDYDLRDREAAEKYTTNDKEVLSQGRAIEFTESTINDMGEAEYFHSVKFPLYDSNDQIYAVCGISTDITDRRKAQTLAGHSESKYRTLFENANDAILIIRDWHFVDLNQRALNMFDCAREDILGKIPLEFSAETQPGGISSEVLVADILGAAIAGEPQLTEWKFRRLDGTLFDTEINLSRIILDGSPSVLAIVRDISERKRSEKDLVRQRELLETSVNATPGSYYMFNTRGEVVFSNQAFQDVIGKTPQELRQINVVEKFVHPDDLPLANEAIETALKTGQTVNQQIRVITGDKQVRTILGTASRFYIDDEAFIVGAAVDITDRVAVEDELHQHRERLEELVAERTTELETANRELEAFSYSVSHDLRAPLRTINGFSQALVEDYGDSFDEQGRRYLDRVLKSSVRMGNLIDDILQLSRINRAALNFNRIDLSAMATDILEQMTVDYPERRVKINILPGLIANADPRLMTIVLTNLLDNAWKYTAKIDAAEIEFSQVEVEGERVFYVRDNGAGFDMPFVDKLFGAFQRLHGDEFPGTGIGLATVARVVYRHGGRIWADAQVHNGATFYFKIKDRVVSE